MLVPQSALVAAAAALLVGALPAVAGAAEPEPIVAAVFTGSDCVEVAGIVVLPTETVAAVAGPHDRPASFLLSTLASYTGLDAIATLPLEGALLMGVETCQDGTIDGTPIRHPFAFGERVVEIMPRDTAKGFHFYAVEQVSDSPELVALLRAQGLPTRLVPGISGAATAAGGVSKGGDVDITATAPLPIPSPLSTVSNWHDGPSGTAVLRLDVGGARSAGGLAEVSATPGSAMARLLDTGRALGIGAVNRFDLTARLEVLPG